MSESFAELLEESFANQKIKPGAILTGTVVGVNQDVVIVNAGLKSEAVIPADQFMNERGELEVKVGDHVEVALDTVEDGFGETRSVAREGQAHPHVGRSSRKRSRTVRSSRACISGRVKGGFTVDVEFVRAFLPGSLVDVRPVRDPSVPRGQGRSSSRSSSSTGSATTSSCRVVPSSRPSTAQSAKRCSRICRKAPSSRAS